jgi:hypothetical protein
MSTRLKNKLGRLRFRLGFGVFHQPWVGRTLKKQGEQGLGAATPLVQVAAAQPPCSRGSAWALRRAVVTVNTGGSARRTMTTAIMLPSTFDDEPV